MFLSLPGGTSSLGRSGAPGYNGERGPIRRCKKSRELKNSKREKKKLSYLGWKGQVILREINR